eukprot:TRINITY_DN28229_c0_g1_i1.p1 TRINITY_DN28229_c0_g1~~TRINITY_DN28229_c0_g1_i1.p1  ORF type:complete len:195 (-),score=28.60 TRINITY_DN28229_c0_g1_i1:115-699(-)
MFPMTRWHIIFCLLSIAAADLDIPGSCSDGVKARHLLQLEGKLASPSNTFQSYGQSSLASTLWSRVSTGGYPFADLAQIKSKETNSSHGSEDGVMSALIIGGSLFVLLVCCLGFYAFSEQTTEISPDRRLYAREHAQSLLNGSHGEDKAASVAQVMEAALAAGATPEEAAQAAKEQMRKDQRLTGRAARQKECC